MTTQCTATQLEFQPFGRRQVTGRFDGGRLTSDAGGLLLLHLAQQQPAPIRGMCIRVSDVFDLLASGLSQAARGEYIQVIPHQTISLLRGSLKSASRSGNHG